MRWLDLIGGVLLTPRRTLSALQKDPPGFWFFARIMAAFWVATMPMAIARVVLASDRGGLYLLHRLVLVLVEFAALPLFVCTGLGLAVVAYLRLRRRPAALDLLVPAALFLWLPTGVMGLLGQVLLSLGLNVPYLPHLSLSWFFASQPSATDVLLRIVLSYGWSIALAWVFVRIAHNIPDADDTPPASGSRGGGIVLASVWALSLGTGALGIVRHYDDLRPLSRGDPAPPALGVSLDEQRRLIPKDFQGQPAVIEFWATWCPTCVSSMPRLIEWARLHPRVKVLAIHSGGPREEVAEFVRARGWSGIDFLVDESGEAAAAWRVDTYPTVVTLNADGRIAGIRIGEPSHDWLESHLSVETPPPQVEHSR